MPKQPYVVVEGKRATAYYIGIIDFLQGWTGGKKCAHVIKVIFAPKPVRLLKSNRREVVVLLASSRRGSKSRSSNSSTSSNA